MKILTLFFLTFAATVAITIGIMKPELLQQGLATLNSENPQTEKEAADIPEMGEGRADARKRSNHRPSRKGNQYSRQRLPEQPDEFEGFMRNFHTDQSGSSRKPTSPTGSHSRSQTPSRPRTTEDVFKDEKANEEFMKGFQRGLQDSIRSRPSR